VVRRGFKCRDKVFQTLLQSYERVLSENYNGNLLKALQEFDYLAEKKIREELSNHCRKPRSRDQAWRTCKGSLYEYAVFKYIRSVIESDEVLREKIGVIKGDEGLKDYKSQVSIKNWSEIYPDIDLIVVEKKNNRVLCVISCKTSLRERLAETAFWKRELEKKGKNIKYVFVTTDKDHELQTETNRYILLHVVDLTFITDPNNYGRLIGTYERRYGKRKDFETLKQKIKPIGEMEDFLKSLVKEST